MPYQPNQKQPAITHKTHKLSNKHQRNTTTTGNASRHASHKPQANRMYRNQNHPQTPTETNQQQTSNPTPFTKTYTTPIQTTNSNQRQPQITPHPKHHQQNQTSSKTMQMQKNQMPNTINILNVTTTVSNTTNYNKPQQTKANPHKQPIQPKK